MNVQAEVSLYPLRTHDLGHAIGRFLGALKAGFSLEDALFS